MFIVVNIHHGTSYTNQNSYINEAPENTADNQRNSGCSGSTKLSLARTVQCGRCRSVPINTENTCAPFSQYYATAESHSLESNKWQQTQEHARTIPKMGMHDSERDDF